MEDETDRGPDSKERQESDDADQRRPWRSGFTGIAAGYMLLAAILVGLLLGAAIDAWQDTAPRWTAITAGIFIVIGLYQVVKDNWPRS